LTLPTIWGLLSFSSTSATFGYRGEVLGQRRNILLCPLTLIGIPFSRSGRTKPDDTLSLPSQRSVWLDQRGIRGFFRRHHCPRNTEWAGATRGPVVFFTPTSWWKRLSNQTGPLAWGSGDPRRRSGHYSPSPTRVSEALRRKRRNFAFSVLLSFSRR